MSLIELYKIIKKYYGYKTNNIYINSEKNEVIAELYESFVTKYHIDEMHNEFYAGIVIGEENDILCGKILGEKLAMSATEDLIIKNLSIVDKYCRLRLPDKFLEAYEKSHQI